MLFARTVSCVVLHCLTIRLTWDNGSIADRWSFFPSEGSPLGCSTKEAWGALLGGFISFDGPRTKTPDLVSVCDEIAVCAREASLRHSGFTFGGFSRLWSCIFRAIGDIFCWGCHWASIARLGVSDPDLR